MQEITLDALIENIPKVTDWVEEQLADCGCPMKVLMQINIAIDELFSNIANYAYAESGSVGKATVRLRLEEDFSAVEITFIDNGIPYNPLEKADPDITLSIEERPIGGLGIFMVKKSMDDVSYEYRDGQNVLTIRKNFK